MCNLIYYWLTRNADADGRATIDEDLDRPPTGERISSDTSAWSADAEMAEFRRAASTV